MQHSIHQIPDRVAAAARHFGVSPEKFMAFLLKAQNDSVFWIESVTGDKLWSKQRDICYSLRDNRMTCVPACNASGKTRIAAALVAYGINNLMPYLGITTAPTERQVKHALWKEIRDFVPRCRVPLAGKPDLLQWIVSERQRALGFATSDYNPNLFQGIRESNNTTLILDEACGVAGDVYEGALGIMGAGRARMLQLGNPVDPLTRFKEECESPYNTTIHISAYDTPNFNIPGHELREKNFIVSNAHPDSWRNVLAPQYYDAQKKETRNLPTPYLTTPEFVESIVRSYGPTSPQYISRVLGRFPEQSEEALFTLSEIEDAMNPELPSYQLAMSQAKRSPLELGVDVARFGSNMNVIMGWQDPVLRILDVFSKTDTYQTAERVRQCALKCVRHGLPPIAVKVDVIGVGGGVVDNLSHQLVDWGRGSQRFPVVAYNSASTDGIPERVKNVRVHSYLQFKERMESRTIALPAKHSSGWADQLRKELPTIRTSFKDGSDEIVILGKEALKAQGIPSPDFVDAAVIAAYSGPRSRGDYGVSV